MKVRLLGAAALVAALIFGGPIGCAHGTSGPSGPPRVPGQTGPVHYDHQPDASDVTSVKPGESFLAQPNFHYFVACGRPCWQPLYPEAKIIKGAAVTDGWPCEAYDTTSKARGPYCASMDNANGDWVQVLCQVTGQDIRNEHKLPNGSFEHSNVWDVFEIEKEQLRPGLDASKLKLAPDGKRYRVYGPDLWFGNTSVNKATGQADLTVHHLPCP